MEELVNTHVGRRAMVCTVKLNEQWCDCGAFQAFRIPCSHVIAACAYCSMDFGMFVDPVYRLEYIQKAYKHEFHPLGNEEYWPSYLGPNCMPNPKLRRDETGRPKTSRIHNEMDTSAPPRAKKCTFCRSEGHNRSQCPYKQSDD